MAEGVYNTESNLVSLNSRSKNNGKINKLFLTKYTRGTEYFLIFLGIIFSILLGCCLPHVPLFIGNFFDVIFGIVMNINIKKIVNTKDENVLISMMEAVKSNDTAKIQSFKNDHPNIEFDSLKNRLQNIPNIEKVSMNFQTLDASMDKLYSTIYKFLIVAGCALIAGFISYICLTYVYSRITSRIYIRMFNFCNDSCSSKKSFSDDIQEKLGIIKDKIGFGISKLFRNTTRFIICFIIAFIYQWKLSLVLLSVILVLAIVLCLMGYTLKVYTKKNRNAFDNLISFINFVISNNITAVALENQSIGMDNFNRKLRATKKYQYIVYMIRGIILGLVFALGLTGLGLFFKTAVKYMDAGDMDRSDMLRVLISIVLGAVMAASIPGIIKGFKEVQKEVTKLENDFEHRDSNENLSILLEEQSLKGHIVFENVSDSSSKLKDFSLDCQPGQVIALVGDENSGKSIVLQLLERFATKENGNILIDGKEIESYNTSWLRHQMGMVSETPVILNTTISENISLANPDVSEKHIEEASKWANAYVFISKLKNGFDTVLMSDEDDASLTPCQKQSICFARAFLIKPKILLLDEAISVIDSDTEKTIQNSIKTSLSNPTVIMTTNRLSTLKNVDQIIVMSEGTVVESGCHDDLMKNEKYYYQMVMNHTLKDEKDVEKQDSSEIRERSNITEKPDIIIENETTENNKGTNNIVSFYFSQNKSYLWAIILGWIGNIMNGAILPFISLFITNILAKSEDNNNIVLYFVILGIASFISYLLQFGGHYFAGENSVFDLRKKLFFKLLPQNPDDEDDIANTNTNTTSLIKNSSPSELITEAGLIQGFSRIIGFILEVITVLVVGFILIITNTWKLGLCLLLLILLILFLISIKALKSTKTLNSSPSTQSLLMERDDSNGEFSNFVNPPNPDSTKSETEPINNLKLYFNSLLYAYLSKLINIKELFIESIRYGIKQCVVFLILPLVFYILIVCIKNEYIEMPALIKTVITFALTIITILRAKIHLPDIGKTHEALVKMMSIVGNK